MTNTRRKQYLGSWRIIQPEKAIGYPELDGTNVDPGRLLRAALMAAAEESPAEAHGRKFQGRKPGAYGPLRNMVQQLVERLAQRKSRITPKYVWHELMNKPPKRWEVKGYPAIGKGKIIHHATGRSWPYKRFADLICEATKPSRRQKS